MPDQTPGGLPFPLATDPLTDGAAAIEALAVAIDERVAMFHRAAAQAVAPGAVVVIPLEVVAAASPKYSLNAGGVLIASAGIYEAIGKVTLPGLAGGTARLVGFLLDGVETSRAVYPPPFNGALPVADSFIASAGQRLTIYCYQDSGAALNTGFVQLTITQLG